MTLHPRAACVTGIGLVTPLGGTTAATWKALLAGRCGIAPITLFDPRDLPVRIAGEVRDFSPHEVMPRAHARHIDRFIALGLAAAEQARADAGGLAHVDPGNMACTVSTGMGGWPWIERAALGLHAEGVRRGVSPYLVTATLPNMLAGEIALRIGAKGPSVAPVSACASGAHSLGMAADMLMLGHADVVLAGAAEAVVSPLGVASFAAARALSTRNEEPLLASRPFSASRDGFVLSEGAAVLVLEAWEHARARDAQVYAVLAGFAATSDAHHMTAPDPSGAGVESAMRLALSRAGLAAEDLDYVNAHATGTRADTIEAQALTRVLGPAPRAHVQSTKAQHGHLLGAAGGLEAALCVLALRDQSIPPPCNLDDLDETCIIAAPRRCGRVRHALSNSLGFGGTNTAMIWSSPQGTP